MRIVRKGFWRQQLGHEDCGGVWRHSQGRMAKPGTVRPLWLAGGRKVDLRACAGPAAAAGAGLGHRRPLLRRCAAPRTPGRRWHTASGRHRVGADGCADLAQAVGLWVVDREPPWILTGQCLCGRGKLTGAGDLGSWLGPLCRPVFRNSSVPG